MKNILILLAALMMTSVANAGTAVKVTDQQSQAALDYLIQHSAVMKVTGDVSQGTTLSSYLAGAFLSTGVTTTAKQTCSVGSQGRSQVLSCNLDVTTAPIPADLAPAGTDHVQYSLDVTYDVAGNMKILGLWTTRVTVSGSVY